MNRSPLIGYTITLVVLNVVLFALHLLVLNGIKADLLDNYIIGAYLFNALFAVAVGSALYVLRHKFTSSLGFIFLGGTMIKFLLFFLIFKPLYSEDGNMDKVEFLTFFVPYLLNLFAETLFLVRVLNRLK